MIPGAVGIYDRDWPLLTNTQTIRFCSIYAALALGEAEIGEPLLQIIPGRKAFFARGALGFSLIRAQKDVALDFADTQVFGQPDKAVAIHRLRITLIRSDSSDLQTGRPLSARRRRNGSPPSQVPMFAREERRPRSARTPAPD